MPPALMRVIEAVRQSGAIVHPGPGCIQLVPALIYSRAGFDELMACVRQGLTELAAGGRSWQELRESA